MRKTTRSSGTDQQTKPKAASHLKKWLELVVQPGEVTELFIKERQIDGLEIRPNYVGFYDANHHDQLAKDAIKCSGISAGIYFRMNPVISSLLARSCNRLKSTKHAQCAVNDDIVRRRLLMVDVDPVRPGGISANLRERKAAEQVAEAVREFLNKQGWPEPAYVDTGNGFSQLYGLDLPADDGGLVQRVLQSLDSQLGNEKARVDTSVHDPARLARLPGTKNCKGDEVEDRLHRLCRVLCWPKGSLLPVPRELLERIAAHDSNSQKSTRRKRKSDDSVIAKARSYVSKMPRAIAGQKGHDATFSVACRLIVGFDLSIDEALPLMREYSEGCKPPWSEFDLRKKLDDANEVDEPRGKLRVQADKAQDSAFIGEPLTGAEFLGYVPDFADAGRYDVLDELDECQLGVDNLWYWPRYFLVWQMQRTDIGVPDVWWRQFIWGGTWPKNWRKALHARVNFNPPKKRPPQRCRFSSRLCPLSASNVRHQHFGFNHNESWGVLEGFTESTTKNGHRIFNLHADTKKEEKQQLRREGSLIRAYWPGLLFGPSPRIGWNIGQQRLLQGIVYELTRPHGQKHGQQIVSESKVITGGIGTHLVVCPLLDSQRKYVVFGGNGRRQGRGYQIVGRTSKGWLHRAGFPAAPELGSPIRIKNIKMLLDNFEILAHDLEMVVVGYHAKRKQWKDIADLKACLRTGSGRDWLEECSLRIYAPDD